MASPGHEDDNEQRDAEFPSPDTFFAGMDALERAQMVERALASLPDHHRVPLVLFHFEQLSYDEIAAKLGVSLAKVKIDMMRGRAALAQKLNRGLAADKVALS